jgi:solute carrier family 25 phosphate transporter 3
VKYRNLMGSLRTIIREEGSRATWKGWAPTILGYSPQGAMKFGLYEVFKDALSNFVGYDYAQKYRGLIWLSGAAAAEFCGCLALCPMEMVKVKVQTSVPGTFPTGLIPATIAMNTNRKVTRFPYGSIVPLWSRQIPYTVTKFYFFEKVLLINCDCYFSVNYFRPFNCCIHMYLQNQRQVILKVLN